MFLSFLFFCFLFLINPIKSDVPKERRIDCAPGRIKNKDFCVSKGCTWDDNGEPDTVPLCYFPANTGYIVPGTFSSGDKSISLKKSSQSVGNPFGNDFSDLTFQWKEIGSGVYIKIAPSQGSRYRPPIDINDSPNLQSVEKLTVQSTNSSIFSFTVSRTSDNENLWDTSLGGLLFADQYIQISTLLSTKQIFGFGENVHKTLMVCKNCQQTGP
jgi:hypothetical protein